MQAAVSHLRIKASVPPPARVISLWREEGRQDQPPLRAPPRPPGLLSERLLGPETHHHFWVGKS